MKRVLLVACIALLAMSGCRSVSSVTNSITGTNDSLLAQVPQDQMAAVDDARFQLSVAEEEVKLAELKEELANHEEDLADNELKQAKNVRERREIALDVAKAEAILAADLVDSFEGAKDVNAYKKELLDNESDNIDIKVAIRKNKRTIQNLQEQIKEQERVIAGMTDQPVAAEAGIAPAEESAIKAKTVSEEPAEEVTLPDYMQVEEDPDAGLPPEGSGTELEEGALPE